MGVIVAIEPDDDLVTKYCWAFRNEYIYTPFDLCNPASGFRFALHRGADAVPAIVHQALTDPDVEFITGSGHGSPMCYTGYQGIVIWDAQTLLSAQVDDCIVHLLSCHTGAYLGRECIRRGARAFWGYDVEFMFWHQDPPPKNLADDRTAAKYLRMDAIIDRGILKGQNATVIYKAITNYFWQVYPQLLQHAPGQAGTFFDNFVHLVCPAVNWGDPSATFSP